MSSFLKTLISQRALLPLLFCFPAGILTAQSLTLISGNGQIVPEQSHSNAPLVVQAKDGAGHPAAGVPITWAITQGAGTLSLPSVTTDSNGLASTYFVATSLFGNSFKAATVTASSPSGTVSFIVTTVISSSGLGASFQFVSPPQSNPNLAASSGSTLPGAVVDRVFAEYGNQAGAPIPNVAVRIVNALDHSASTAASCNGPGGIVFTDNTGTATCDLFVTGPAGTIALDSYIGEQQYSYPFNLEIAQGAACSYSLSAPSQSVGTGGGTGSVNVVTTSGCSWTAVSSASWITITAGASGSGSAAVGYSVAANAGTARTGTLTIAGLTYTVNQSGTASAGLAITTSSLKPGTVNVTYSAMLAATGGQPPYSWSVTSGSLPPGLTLDAATGVISGTPTSALTHNFTATVRDSAGASQSQNLSITISGGSTSSSFAITTSSLPNGAAGQPYPQATITTVNGDSCGSIGNTVSFTMSAGNLPPGLSIQGSTIVGTPTVPGTYNFTLSATSPCGNIATAQLAITITGTAPQMTVSPSSLAFTVQQGVSNIPADQQIALNSGSTALSYTAAASTSTGGNWLTIKSSATGNTPATLTAGLANYSGLAPGSYTGSINITSQASNSPVSVAVTLTVLAAEPLIASPGTVALNEFASTGSNITKQLISLNAGSSSTQFTATTSTTSGGQWLLVTPTAGSTPATLTATIDSGGLAPGTYKGSVVITPAVGGIQTVTVALVVSEQPPSITSVVNAASFVLGPVSPGEIVTIFGSALGPSSIAGLQLTTSGSVATNVSGTRVLFDGTAAPIIYTSAGQVSVIVPYEVAGNATTNVQLQYQGLLSNTLPIRVADSAPGIFTAQSTGSGEGAILNQDESVNSSSNGADPGSVISIFATGEGQTNPPGVDGAINATTLPLPAPKLPVTVQIGGQAATVSYAGAAPGGVAGFLQVNAQIPAGIPRGASATVAITVGNASSQTVTVAIKP